jgi:hypothetical protein
VSAWLAERPAFGLSLSLLGVGRTYGGFAYAQALGHRFGIGTGIAHFSAGSFTARSASGEAIGTYTPQNVALALCGAFRWEFLSVGVMGKYLWSGLSGGGISGQGVAADLGALFRVAELFSVGVLVSNLGGFMQWEGVREYPRRTFAMGIATELGIAPRAQRRRLPFTGEEQLVWEPASRYILLSAEMRYTEGMPRPEALLALEAVPFQGFALRGGVTLLGNEAGRLRWFSPQRLGGGLALQLPRSYALPFLLQLDYALSYEYSSPSRLAHTVGLTAQLP